MIFNFFTFQTNTGFRVVHPSTTNYTIQRGGGPPREIAEYDLAAVLNTERLVNVAVQYKQNIPQLKTKPPLLHAHRFQTGEREIRNRYLGRFHVYSILFVPKSALSS